MSPFVAEGSWLQCPKTRLQRSEAPQLSLTVEGSLRGDVDKDKGKLFSKIAWPESPTTTAIKRLKVSAHGKVVAAFLKEQEETSLVRALFVRW